MTATKQMENPSTYVEWSIVESNKEPKNVLYDTLPPKTKELIHTLMAVGVLGSSQLKNIFLSNNKKHLSVLKSLDIILEHKLIINNKTFVPVYTLGRTGLALEKQLGGNFPLNYWLGISANKVRDSIAVGQLLGRYREDNDTTVAKVSDASPFKAVFLSPYPKGMMEYTIGVIRDVGDVEKFSSFFRIGERIPERMIFIVTDISLMRQLTPLLQPFIKKVRVVQGNDMKHKVKFIDMFYSFDAQTQQWEKRS